MTTLNTFRRLEFVLGMLLWTSWLVPDERCWAQSATLSAMPGPATSFGIGHSQPSHDPSDKVVELAEMRELLEEQVVRQPQNAGAWRLLGRLRLQAGDVSNACAAFERSLALNPHSAACHFDMSQALLPLQRDDEAVWHLRRAVQLAPDSPYADDARLTLARLNRPLDEPADVELAGYEIKRFDGSDALPRPRTLDATAPQERRPVYVRLETGALYNTNAALTPISRELFPGRRASAQFFVAPELEWRIIDNAGWGCGPTFLGYFNVNEGDFRDLNQQSYQPGFFAERFVVCDPLVLVPRWQYGLTHDEFDGRTLGNRHAVTASATALWNNKDLSFVYGAVDHTDLLNDGDLPSASSRDGWSYALGVSHSFWIGRRHLQTLRFGADVQRADLAGTDFAYDGVSLYGDVDMPLTETLSLLLEGGWGYRDYADSELVPSRNENIWRTGIRLTKAINSHWSISGVVNYDRFDSKNTLFDAERFLAGLLTTWEY